MKGAFQSISRASSAQNPDGSVIDLAWSSLNFARNASLRWCGFQFFLLPHQLQQWRDLLEQARQMRNHFGSPAGANQR